MSNDFWQDRKMNFREWHEKLTAKSTTVLTDNFSMKNMKLSDNSKTLRNEGDELLLDLKKQEPSINTKHLQKFYRIL